MASFTTEEAVRGRFQWADEAWVPSAVIAAGIEDAHESVLRSLAPAYGEGAPPEALVLGETALAGARVYRLLAAKEAFDRREARVGGQDSGGLGRFEALNETGRRLEEEAWTLLEPFMAARAARSSLKTSDSTSVLGEE